MKHNVKTESIHLSEQAIYASEMDRSLQRPLFTVKIVIDDIDTDRVEAVDGVTFEPHFRLKESKV